MKKYIIAILTFLLSPAVKAQFQDDFPVNQYVFNSFFLNPAAAGIKKFPSVTVLGSRQNTKIPGAPQSNYLSFDMPLTKMVGMGLTISNDKIGVSTQNSAFLAYSFHFNIDPTTYLSFGLRTGFSSFVSNLGQVTKWDNNDPILEEDISRMSSAKFGSGVFLYGKSFYAGISVPQLVNYNLESSIGNEREVLFQKSFNITGGYIYKLHDNISIKPSILFKNIESVGSSTHYTLNFLFCQTIWAGATYQSNGGVGFNSLIQIGRFFKAGYGYNYSLSNENRLINGVHEIMIGVDFGYDKVKMSNPRYF